MSQTTAGFSAPRRGAAARTLPLVGARPILPAMLERRHQLNTELTGLLAARLAASRKQHGIVKELRWLRGAARRRASSCSSRPATRCGP